MSVANFFRMSYAMYIIFIKNKLFCYFFTVHFKKTPIEYRILWRSFRSAVVIMSVGMSYVCICIMLNMTCAHLHLFMYEEVVEDVFLVVSMCRGFTST